MSSVDLQTKFRQLDLPPNASAAAKQGRGYKFEQFLTQMLKAEKLEPRLRLRPSGEEIDGSFHFGDRTYLLEAKWHSAPISASSIYAFKGKVDGKLSGTVGIFVSMSGYSKNAVDALTAGKGLNVLLFDGSDIEACIDHRFRRILGVKLRAAAEQGVVFFPFKATSLHATDGVVDEHSPTPTDAISLARVRGQIAIICEGQADRVILTRFSQRILEEQAVTANVIVLPAQGKFATSRVANALSPLLSNGSRLIVVVDGDGDRGRTVQTMSREIQVPCDVVVVEPTIEAWLVPDSPDPSAEIRRRSRKESTEYLTYLAKAAEQVDMQRLLAQDSNFKKLHGLLVSQIRSS